MLRPAYAAICHHARDGQPAIVFVPTRKHAKMAALDLLTHAAADGAPHKFRQAQEADLEPYLDKVADAALKHSLRWGTQTGMPMLRVVAGRLIAHPAAIASAPCPCMLSAHAALLPDTTHAPFSNSPVLPLAMQCTLIYGHIASRPPRLCSYGVAFLHETQSEEEQGVARLLFESGAVQVGAPQRSGTGHTGRGRQAEVAVRSSTQAPGGCAPSSGHSHHAPPAAGACGDGAHVLGSDRLGAPGGHYGHAGGWCLARACGCDCGGCEAARQALSSARPRSRLCGSTRHVPTLPP